MNNYDRDLGRLEADVSSLKKQNAELKEEIKILHTELTEIKGLILQIKGGSKVLFWLGGLVSGAGGAALFKYLPLLFVR